MNERMKWDPAYKWSLHVKWWWDDGLGAFRMSENEVPNMFFGVGRWSIPMIITHPTLFYTLPLTFLSFPTQKGKRKK